jgi:hypothetical protein
LKSVSEEIFEDIMGLEWGDFSEDNVVIVFLSELIGKSIVGLVHLHELLMSSFIIRIIFGVILDGKLPVGILDVIQSGSCG